MKEDRIIMWIGVAVIVVALCLAIAQPYFEARTFNRMTGGDAGYWDAAFSELRVIGGE